MEVCSWDSFIYFVPVAINYVARRLIISNESILPKNLISCIFFFTFLKTLFHNLVHWNKVLLQQLAVVFLFHLLLVHSFFMDLNNNLCRNECTKLSDIKNSSEILQLHSQCIDSVNKGGTLRISSFLRFFATFKESSLHNFDVHQVISTFQYLVPRNQR